MALPPVSRPASPSANHPPGANPALLGGHQVRNISSDVQKRGVLDRSRNVFGKIKDNFTNMNQTEKDYLWAAAAIVGIVVLLMAVLGFVFGFGAFTMALAPLAFAACYPLYKFAQSKNIRKEASPEEIQKYEEAYRKKQAQIQESHRVENAQKRKNLLLSSHHSARSEA